MRFLSVVFAVWAGAVQAQFIADGVDTQTGAGSLRIVDGADGWSRTLSVGDAMFFGDGAYRFISVEKQLGALYLVSLSTGGTGCAAQYAWLHTEGGVPRVSEVFGNCSDLAQVEADAETVTVILPARVAADGFTAFVYDGEQVRETTVGQQAAGVGRAAQGWVGRYPFEVMRDADWRAPLVTLMGEEDYRRAGEIIATASPMEREGGWVVGRGFNNRMAQDNAGVVAIHDDGRILVAVCVEEAGAQMWGAVNGVVPPTVLAVLGGC